jgi:hypothetical protein
MPLTTSSLINENTPLKKDINKKDFLKADLIKMRDLDSYFAWNTDLHVHCQMNGVFCPSMKEMASENIMDHGWSQLQVGDEKIARQSEISSLLWKILAHEDMFPTKEGDLLQEQVMASG